MDNSTPEYVGDMTPTELLDALGAIAGNGQTESDDNDLGFIDNPGGNGETEFVFLNRTEHPTGHMVDEDGNPVPLPGDAMAGYVEDVYYESRTHDTYGLMQKLRVVLDCEGSRLMAETGFFSNTSKSLLANLAGVQDPGARITIEPSLPDDPQDSPNVLFTELYENGELIQDTNGDWPQEDEDVIDLFHFVREDVFGFEPQDVEPQLPDRSSGGGSGGGRGGRSGNGRSSNGRSRNNRGSSQGNGARGSDRRQSGRRKELPTFNK